MYGDPGALRALAARVDGFAAELQAELLRAAGAAQVQWHSTAAERFRAQLEGERNRLEHHTADLQRLAQTLRNHALALEERLEEIARAEAFVMGQLAEARSLLDRAENRVVEEAGQALGGVLGWAKDVTERVRDLPEHGSIDWIPIRERLL